jgi:hypothetical protein
VIADAVAALVMVVIMVVFVLVVAVIVRMPRAIGVIVEATHQRTSVQRCERYRAETSRRGARPADYGRGLWASNRSARSD